MSRAITAFGAAARMFTMTTSALLRPGIGARVAVALLVAIALLRSLIGPADIPVGVEIPVGGVAAVGAIVRWAVGLVTLLRVTAVAIRKIGLAVIVTRVTRGAMRRAVVKIRGAAEALGGAATVLIVRV